MDPLINLLLSPACTLAASERLVLLVLRLAANACGETHLTRRDLARATDMGYRTVLRVIDSLKEKDTISETDFRINIHTHTFLPRSEGGGIIGGSNKIDLRINKDAGTRDPEGCQNGNQMCQNGIDVCQNGNQECQNGIQAPDNHPIRAYQHRQQQRSGREMRMTARAADAYSDGHGGIVQPNYTDDERRFLDAYGKHPYSADLFRVQLAQAVAETNDLDMLIAAAGIAVAQLRERDGSTRYLPRPENWLRDHGWRDYEREANRCKQTAFAALTAPLPTFDTPTDAPTDLIEFPWGQP